MQTQTPQCLREEEGRAKGGRGTTPKPRKQKLTVSLTLDFKSTELLHSGIFVMLEEWGSMRAISETKYYLKQRSRVFLELMSFFKILSVLPSCWGSFYVDSL